MPLGKLMLACAPLAALLLAGCDVDVHDTGEPPDVQVEGGRAPDVEVTPPNVDVQTEEREVTVPNVNVDVTPERTRVKAPNVDIQLPEENEPEPDAAAP